MTSWCTGWLLASALVASSGTGDWDYVVNESRPIWSRLHLDPSLPADVSLEVEVAEGARYGWLRYGEESSRRVVVMLNPRADGSSALYADLDRDLVLREDEGLPGDESLWSTSIAVEVSGAGPCPERVVRFRRSAITGGLSWGTAGHIEGEIGVGGTPVAVRRGDGDGNGLFSDSRDLLWVDLDGDGRFDSLQERFAYSPLLELKGKRFALRSDRLGHRLRFEEVSGTGWVSLSVGDEAAGSAPTVSRLGVLLVSRDGSAVGVSAHGTEVEVPVGEWRVGMVTLGLADPAGGLDWSFVFSDSGGPIPPRWFRVDDGEHVALDPVGAVEFRVGLTEGLDRCSSGQELRVQPRLYTQDGLLINIVYRGKKTPVFGRDDSSALVRLKSAEGTLLDLAHTGFA